eukprot:gnl/TRDRNA2_/TRDRNA2_93238_c0_seq1.p1 gnl/TRDRNA2_/TRDRNA2_93238_c0~~gnl/TRDRNA2_/TRDRNA2_93238_c0_seq1.p1  ORF type:complete len:326 (+),score=51.65 gnl/TRDRNA2_/TRDRNA2_93238_c0_seq1:127-1104(+)
MHRCTIIVLFSAASQAYARELVANYTANIQDRLVRRALLAVGLRRTDLDGMVLGKGAPSAVVLPSAPCCNCRLCDGCAERRLSDGDAKSAEASASAKPAEASGKPAEARGRPLPMFRRKRYVPRGQNGSNLTSRPFRHRRRNATAANATGNMTADEKEANTARATARKARQAAIRAARKAALAAAKAAGEGVEGVEGQLEKLQLQPAAAAAAAAAMPAANFSKGGPVHPAVAAAQQAARAAQRAAQAARKAAKAAKAAANAASAALQSANYCSVYEPKSLVQRTSDVIRFPAVTAIGSVLALVGLLVLRFGRRAWTAVQRPLLLA